jgi:two-component sensor histidine kinase
MDGSRWGSFSTIRVRLTAALAVALLPVLILGAVQSSVAFRREADAVQTELAASAQRSAMTARARIEAADILLETLAPGSVGFQCAQRLAEVTHRIPGYENLIRFDSQGRVACAAADVPSDPGRMNRTWFARLGDGDQLVITRDPGAVYADKPVLLAAVPAMAPDGGFDGALVAVISLESLAPKSEDLSAPKTAAVAIADSTGRIISVTDPLAFSTLPPDWRAASSRGSNIWYATDRRGERRVFSSARLVGGDIFVILSSRSEGLFSWARLNPLTGLAFPLLTFVLALLAVSMVTDRVVVRWISYLQRIAALYARGRLSVRPIQAERMPPEIRDLAETLEQMADAIVGRDASLRDSLAQKDELMREIHHRVKNNLQVISSLINMQRRSLSDPAAREAMSDTGQRITALALIYRALYQGPDLKRVDLRPFLEELTAQLVAGELLRGPPVRTELHVDALVIDPDRLAPLALFAVEAITNAQKHAFAQAGGTLSVTFQVHGEDAVLEIADDGQSGEEALTKSGVGRTLMVAFARQLRGRSELVRNANHGLTARLTFPTAAPEISEAATARDGNQAAA